MQVDWITLGMTARLLTRAIPALAVAGPRQIARLLTRAIPALAVAGPRQIARLLTRAIPALAVAGPRQIARLLTRAIPALAVAGLGMDRYFRGGGFDNLRRRITGFRWAAARHLLGDILGDRSGSGMIENHGRWQRQSGGGFEAVA